MKELLSWKHVIHRNRQFPRSGQLAQSLPGPPEGLVYTFLPLELRVNCRKPTNHGYYICLFKAVFRRET